MRRLRGLEGFYTHHKSALAASEVSDEEGEMICDLCNEVASEYEMKIVRYVPGDVFVFHRLCRLLYLEATWRRGR